MADHRYLFIDGGYLRARHVEALTGVFGKVADLDLSAIRYMTRTEPPFEPFQRVFYYDCLHDILKVDETEEQLKGRIAAQQSFFDELQTYEGFHVRLGSLSGTSRKFRQKEVDILLAVDVLDHAFRQNMKAVTLLAGDLDFAPLVEALVRLGTWVEIRYDRQHTAKRLLEVADKAVPLSFKNYHEWCPRDFRESNVVPDESWQGNFDPTGYQLLKSGAAAGGVVNLYQRDASFALTMIKDNRTLITRHSDPVVLENYFGFSWGPIVWS